ncbi:hypothetical protein QJS10_CPA16g01537 [Acorus calamus]|uniref:Uncharacterized protein n=1 Tax=Acorus calamus TaxID=4465 RepID=A0AAV9D2T0_ACOCL|nr:hypothetical protein QJS10_CPA16g01537 [Acorus calamus]
MPVNVDGVMTTAGLLDSEASVYALSYDISGSRLIICEADKMIKTWKKDETAILSTLATCKKGSRGLKVSMLLPAFSYCLFHCYHFF